MRKLLLVIVLTGSVFYTFHDFVFYKVDPCMQYVETAYKVTDRYCEIHENLHMPYIKPFTHIPINEKFSESYSFNYRKPQLKPLVSDIFKPPKHTA
ncbi:MAG: hypothetical protein Q9M89_01965 [Persephonella sp.]|nr:hypothetical protein [Persephonella sp.]